ncbi:hypothetical protein [Amycolatopsis sp. NPDC004169]|uniref:hypothetical protein n=1 Tax=Amycolatopsis sp. NPDC004169 TaxID=3154453 RepID=UPI0033B84D37
MTTRSDGRADRCGHDPIRSWDDREGPGERCSRCAALRAEVEKLRRCLDLIAASEARPAADLDGRIMARIRGTE